MKAASATNESALAAVKLASRRPKSNNNHFTASDGMNSRASDTKNPFGTRFFGAGSGVCSNPPIACSDSWGRYALSTRPIAAAAARAASHDARVSGFARWARSMREGRSYGLGTHCGGPISPAAARSLAQLGMGQGWSGRGGACA